MACDRHSCVGRGPTNTYSPLRIPEGPRRPLGLLAGNAYRGVDRNRDSFEANVHNVHIHRERSTFGHIMTRSPVIRRTLDHGTTSRYAVLPLSPPPFSRITRASCIRPDVDTELVLVVQGSPSTLAVAVTSHQQRGGIEWALQLQDLHGFMHQYASASVHICARSHPATRRFRSDRSPPSSSPPAGASTGSCCRRSCLEP